MLSPSRTTWSRKGVAMVLDTAKNWRTERVPYSLECVEEMLEKSWLSRWTFQRYSRSLSQRPSLSWITTLNWLDRAKVHRDGRTTISPQRNPKDTKDNGISLWISQAKNAPMRLRPAFRAAVFLKNRLHRESGEELAEPIYSQQCRRWHSSSSDSWWDTSKSWWS